MSTVPFTFLPRSSFFSTTTPVTMPVTSFWWDPFDELDLTMFETTMPSWIQWLNKPEWLTTTPTMPVNPLKKVLQKWRVVIDISGWIMPLKNIKVELKPNNKLFIWGKEEVKENEENVWFKEIKKCFDMPPYVEAEKFVSFIWGSLLIVEVPIKDTLPMFSMKELLPVFTTDKKEISVNITLPPIDWTKIDIIVKDRDVLIKWIDTTIPQPSTPWTTWWTTWMYKKVCSLPENTKWSELKFTWANNMLTITAPLWEMEQWQWMNKTTTVMPAIVDWKQHWTTMPWTNMPWTKEMTKMTMPMPWTWPMTTPMMPWCPMTKTL